MDCGSILITEPSPTETAAQTLQADQVVFTSIRSPTGQGYRIIAASSGVRPDEKTEITRCCPSHDSLCQSENESQGLLSYTLQSGRQCIAYCCHAGREHTARGGQRVYTHMVLLDQNEFQRFHYHPVYVHALLADHVQQQGPILKQQQRIEPLALTPPGNDTRILHLPCAQIQWIWPIASALLQQHSVILNNTIEPVALLYWAMLSIPRDLRKQINLSAGIKFSKSRPLQVVLICSDQDINKRQLVNKKFELLSAEADPAPIPVDYKSWFDLLNCWWQQHRSIEIPKLTNRIYPNLPAHSLNSLAALYRTIDQLRA